jgi:ATP-dependent exoDNAse (exonuclease V) alpha subunit
MTKADRARRVDFNDRDIQIELDFLANNLICDKELSIKVGSQVMCIINIQSDTGIEVCNGSQGIVTGFCDITGNPRVKFNNGIDRVMERHIWISDKIPGRGVSQMPLILAWALTIHKSQGATMDAAEIDVGSGIFECGQTYVALSRVKSLDGLYLTSFDAKRIRINKKVKEFYESLTLYHQIKETNTEVYVPLVIAEAIPVAQPIGSDPFVDYQYVEVQAQSELSEEKYDEDTPISTVKIIKIN